MLHCSKQFSRGREIKGAAHEQISSGSVPRGTSSNEGCDSRASSARSGDSGPHSNPRTTRLSEVEQWTKEGVAEYVKGVADFGPRASHYADAMLREDIDGKALLALSEAHFEKLGLSMGHRVKLLAHLAKLVGGPDEESDKESPRLGSRNIPIAAYLPLQMQALVVPGTGRALLVSESYTDAISQQAARHEATGGLDGAYDRLEQASAQYKWNPLGGGDEPGQIRKAQGGRSLIQDPDYAGTMSDDVSWLRRVVVPAMPQATLRALDWCQIAFTNFICRFIIKHLTMGVDSQGTPFFIDHIRLCIMEGLFESSWRPRVRLAADGRRPVSFANRPGTYMVPMLCYDAETVGLVEFYCRAPPMQAWAPSAHESAPAAGLLCNQGGPSIWRISNNLLYTARPVLSEREPVARSPEAQRHIILVAKRCGPPEFAVLPETGLYDNEIWAP